MASKVCPVCATLCRGEDEYVAHMAKHEADKNAPVKKQRKKAAADDADTDSKPTE